MIPIISLFSYSKLLIALIVIVGANLHTAMSLNSYPVLTFNRSENLLVNGVNIENVYHKQAWITLTLLECCVYSAEV